MVLCDRGEVTLHFHLLIISANNRVSIMKGNSGEHKMTIRKLSVHNSVECWQLFCGRHPKQVNSTGKNEALICFRCKSQIHPPPPLFLGGDLQESYQPWSKKKTCVLLKAGILNVIWRKWLLIPEQENTNISICLFKGNVGKINIE